MEQGSSHEPHFLHDGLAKGGGHNPVGVDGFAGVFPGSLTRSATLGFGAQSLWDWPGDRNRIQASLGGLLGADVDFVAFEGAGFLLGERG